MRPGMRRSLGLAARLFVGLLAARGRQGRLSGVFGGSVSFSRTSHSQPATPHSQSAAPRSRSRVPAPARSGPRPAGSAHPRARATRDQRILLAPRQGRQSRRQAHPSVNHTCRSDASAPNPIESIRRTRYEPSAPPSSPSRPREQLRKKITDMAFSNTVNARALKKSIVSPVNATHHLAVGEKGSQFLDQRTWRLTRHHKLEILPQGEEELVLTQEHATEPGEAEGQQGHPRRAGCSRPPRPQAGRLGWRGGQRLSTASAECARGHRVTLELWDRIVPHGENLAGLPLTSCEVRPGGCRTAL